MEITTEKRTGEWRFEIDMASLPESPEACRKWAYAFLDALLLNKDEWPAGVWCIGMQRQDNRVHHSLVREELLAIVDGLEQLANPACQWSENHSEMTVDALKRVLTDAVEIRKHLIEASGLKHVLEDMGKQ